MRAQAHGALRVRSPSRAHRAELASPIVTPLLVYRSNVSSHFIRFAKRFIEYRAVASPVFRNLLYRQQGEILYMIGRGKQHSWQGVGMPRPGGIAVGIIAN